MVQAIIENRKTMTRRTKGLENFNENPNGWIYDGIDEENDNAHFMEMIDNNGNPIERYKEVIPDYQVGDVLWVRETFGLILSLDEYCYKADFYDSKDKPFLGWKPSRFMPKQACRIFLKVKSIKVERVQDISDEDAKMEGAKSYLKVDDMKKLKGLGNWIIPRPFSMYQFGFLSIWCTINGCDSWLQNPFVFVYEFERIEKPLDFI